MIRCSLFFYFFEFHIIQSPFSANIFPEGDEKMKQKTRLRIRALSLCLAAAVTALPKTAVSAETKKLNDQRKTGYSYYSLLNYYRTDYNRPSRATKGLIDHYEWGDETVYCVNPWMPAAEVSDQYAAQGSIYDWQGITFMQIPQEDGSRVPLVYTPQMIEDIALYAYFGYDYPGHSSEEYYAAAQKLIWERIVQKPVGVYVGNMGCEAVGCGGAPEADLSRQLNEINSLVNQFRNMKISWIPKRRPWIIWFPERIFERSASRIPMQVPISEGSWLKHKKKMDPPKKCGGPMWKPIWRHYALPGTR